MPSSSFFTNKDFDASRFYTGDFSEPFVKFGKGGFSGTFGSPDYKYSPKEGGSSDKWKTALGLASSFLGQSSRDKDGYEESDYPRFGQGFGGGAQQLNNELSVVYPQQSPSFYIPGQQGKPGMGSAIGTIAGIGASFIPGLGPGIAAAMPSIGGTVGGMFG